MKKTIEIFKALSDPNRLRIIKMLEARKMCVCEITNILELATSTVSKHLLILRNANLIEEEKSGKWVYHKIANADKDHKIENMQKYVSGILNKDKQISADRKKTKVVSAEKLCSTK